MVYFDMTAFLTFVYLACEKNCSISLYILNSVRHIEQLFVKTHVVLVIFLKTGKLASNRYLIL
jgi:hypothetical protein